MIDDFKPLRGGKAQVTKKGTEFNEQEPVFKTPEVVAAADLHLDEPAESTKKISKSTPVKRRKLRKKDFIGIAAGITLLLAVIAVPVLAFRKKAPAPAPVAAVVVTPPAPAPEPAKPATEPSRLTGLQISPEANKAPVTAVMIENSPEARPQSGLTEAGVVFEAIAEGGITRFNALFMESQPARIGPVRSVRPYYIDFFAPFDAPIAHAGGSGAALAQLRNEGFKDLDQFANAGAYYRDSSRYAPHNLYTSRAQLLQLQTSKGWTTSTFTGFLRKAEAPNATPNARSIDFKISSALYNPHWDYDAASNSYKRSEGGKPHIDEKSGAQIAPKVVLALVMPHHYEGIYSVYGTYGSGKLYAFQDGVVTEGTWAKSDRRSQFVFKDATGKDLGLNPGQTWISIVAAANAVSYRP